MLALQLAGILGSADGLGHTVSLLVPDSATSGGGPPSNLPFRIERYSTRRRDAFVGFSAPRSAVSHSKPGSSTIPISIVGYESSPLRRRRDPAADHGLHYANHIDDTPLLVDFIDSLALNFEQRARFDRVWRRPVLRFEARRLLNAEAQLLKRSVGGLIVSERDRDWLAARVPDHVADGFTVVPLVIPAPPQAVVREPDVSVTRAVSCSPAISATSSTTTRSVGSCEWCGRAFIALVPRSCSRSPVPGLGAGCVGRWRRPGRGGAVGHSTGHGADTRRFDVSLAPMRAGSGVPVKVLEAWAGGIPVVASPWAAAGAAGRHDENLLIAQTASEWCAAVTRLIDDRPSPDALRKRGRRRVEEHHSVDAARAAIESALRRAEQSR